MRVFSVSILENDNPVRKAIAYIADNNAEEAIKILLETLHHEDWSVRSYAAQIIGELGKINPDIITSGHNDVINKMIHIIKTDKDGWVRESTAKAMGKLVLNVILPTADLKEIIDTLTNLLESDDHDGARGTAAQTLGDIGYNNPDLIIYSIPVIGRKLKKDDSWIVRYYAAYALGMIGSKLPKKVEKYIPILKEMIENDPDPGVKESVKDALKKISEAYNAQK
ncbi:MAG: HEAT repeat domain-containing protein [Candidatus Helarchaeota archaeon]